MSKKKKKKEEKTNFFYSVIPDALQDDKTVSLQAKYLWTAFYRWSRNKGTDHPSTMYPLSFFAEQLGVKKRSVQRWKKELKTSGWIKEIGRFNNSSVIILNKIQKKPLSKKKTAKENQETAVNIEVTSLDELLPKSHDTGVV